MNFWMDDSQGEKIMPVFIVLMNMTPKGAENLKELPALIDKGIKRFEDNGGKLLGFYMLIGEYDYVAVADAPNGKMMAAFLLDIAEAGYVSTKSLRAFSRDDFESMVAKLN
jgi:uncharacterized protein with GYD domain